MSLVITYIGSKGCVMAADKRRIGFYGPEGPRENLEEKLYSGSITTKDELLKLRVFQTFYTKIYYNSQILDYRII